MNRISSRAKITLVLGAVLLLGLVIFLGEYLFQARDWVVFPGNPHVYNRSNLDCGMVTDRSGTLLLNSTSGREYSEDEDTRIATLHLLGDRYSAISAPYLAKYSDNMTGYNMITGLYSMDGIGGTAVLTIHADIQKAAMEALDGYKGTVAVYNYKTGEILCAVTSPSYDPDDVPDIEGDTSGRYDGVYLNRLTQVTYTPGSIFKVATAAAALTELPGVASRTFYCDGSYWVGGDEVVCEGHHGDQSLEEALMNSCNSAFAQIALELGPEKLAKYYTQYGLTESVEFDGIGTAEGHLDLADTDDINVAWGAIGQYTDQINPCRYMLFMGQIAGGGVAANPYLVQSVSSGMLSSYHASLQMTDRIMATRTANNLREMMRYNVLYNYGDYNFPDIGVCAKTGTAERGGGYTATATFAGFASDEDYPLAFICVVEEAGYGRRVCVPIMRDVLAVCVDVIDAERAE